MTSKAIDITKVYPLDDFMALTGLGKKAMRHARKAGLKASRVGRRTYIHGKDWAEFTGSRYAKLDESGKDV